VPLVQAAEAGHEQGVAALQKMQEAAKRLDYSGVYTYQQGNTVLSTRLVHIVDGTGERERVLLLDGKPREYLRHNDASQCLLPDQKVVLVERRESDRFPAVLFDDGSRLAEHYEMKVSETPKRVAGRSCKEITLAPRDAHRYGYRLCADQATSLLLRVQTVAPEGVLTQIVFNTLEIGNSVDSEALNPSWNTKDWKFVELSVQEVDLSSEGWRIPLPPGYRPLTQVLRDLRAERQVKHLVASDGLSTLSVFIEPYAESPQAREPGLLRNGALSAYRTRIGDYWLTVLGEVPPDTVRDLAQRTEYVPLAAH
jgi:sigma-E factor negative regulatory protein RseB